MSAVAPWLALPTAIIRRAIIRAAYQQVQRGGWGPHLDTVEMTSALLDCSAAEVADVVEAKVSERAAP